MTITVASGVATFCTRATKSGSGRIGNCFLSASHWYVTATTGTFHAIGAWPTHITSSGVGTSRIFTLPGAAFHWS